MTSERGFVTEILLAVLVVVTVVLALIQGRGPTEQAMDDPISLTLAAGPSKTFDTWLAETVLSVTYHIPTRTVRIEVEAARWNAAPTEAMRTRAIRQAVCFAAWDEETTSWQWDATETTYHVFQIGETLATGQIRGCLIREAKSPWPRGEKQPPIPSSVPQSRRFF
ncbi:MAG: hypothetical protein Q7T26_10650 [Dehalococcoidia bacterium]|nr:hypothetical protein [Dehalococcoidia bacterium]